MSRQLIIELGGKKGGMVILSRDTAGTIWGETVPCSGLEALLKAAELHWLNGVFNPPRWNLWISSHSMHLKLLKKKIPFSKLQIYIYTSAFTATVSYFHCLLKDFAQRKSPHAVTLTLREGKVGTLGTPGVFCEIKYTLILLWFAVWLPLKHALWHWDPAAFEFWLVVFPHQTLVTLLEKAAQLAPRLAETAY